MRYTIAQIVKSRFLSFAYWKNIVALLPAEIWLFLAFAGSNLFVVNYKPYTVLLILYFCILFLVTHNTIRAAWFTLVGALLFFKARYFDIPFVSNFAISQGLKQETPFVFYGAFFEPMLFLLVYLILRYWRKVIVTIPIRIEFILLIALLFVGILSSLNSQFDEVSWFSLFKVYEYVMLFLISIIVLSDARAFQITMLTILFFIVLNAALIIVQKFSGGPIGLVLEDVSTKQFGRFADELLGLYRPGGLYYEPNLPASLINVVLPLVFSVSIAKKSSLNLNQGLSRIMFIVLGLALIFTASRANWFIAGMSLVTSYTVYRMMGLVKKITLDWRTIIISGAILVLVLPLIVTRTLTLGEALTSKGGWGFRMSHLALSWNFMLQNFWGVGVDVFQYQMLQTYEPSRYFFHFTAPHNIFAEVGSGFGFLGLLVLILFYLTVYLRLVRFFRKHPSGLLIALGMGYSTYLLSANFYPWLFAPPLSELSWIILGACYARSIRKTNKTHH